MRRYHHALPVLRTSGPTIVGVQGGQEVQILLKGAPLAPVSFTAFDLGTFKENGLNSITVQANKDGEASVTFIGGGTAVNDCRILAGSPLASGQVKFVVNVKSPPVRLKPGGP